jgi:replicative DNA helicase
MSQNDWAFQETVETEASLLSGVINLRADLDTPTHLTALEPEAFMSRSHGLMWKAFQLIAKGGNVIDAWSAAKTMRKLGAVDADIQAMEGVFDFAGSSFSAADLRPRIAKIAQFYKRRVLSAAMTTMAEQVLTGNLHELESDFAELGAKIAQAGNPRLRGSTDYNRQFESFLAGEAILPPECRQNLMLTGVYAIDSAIVANPGRLIVVGGLPSAGKTAFAVQVAVRSALNGRRVALGSLEMDEDEISARIVACACGVDSLAALRSNHHPCPENRPILDEIRRNVVGLHGCAGDSWTSVESAIVREHRRAPLQVAIVDYLQLLGEPDTKNRRNETEASMIGEITKSAKRLAQRLKINVVMLSQFNRQVKEGEEPNLQHFLGSGQIERDIDIGLLLWNTDPSPDEKKLERPISCRIAKNRGGKRYGKVHMIFTPAFNQFIQNDNPEPTTKKKDLFQVKS